MGEGEGKGNNQCEGLLRGGVWQWGGLFKYKAKKNGGGGARK